MRFPTSLTLPRSSSASEAAGRALSAVLNLAYPTRCVSCKGPSSTRIPLCLPCARAFDRPLADEVIGHIRRMNPDSSVDDALVLWIFEKNSPVQSIHRDLKYGNRPYYGEILGRMLGLEIRAVHAGVDVVVPVPLHPSRRHDRGYNQSESIAAGICSMTGKPLNATSLIRTRRSKSQTGLSMNERRANVSSIFRVVEESRITGASVLLVDDVVTTGSTVCSAAEALKYAGAESVVIAGIGFARL